MNTQATSSKSSQNPHQELSTIQKLKRGQRIVDINLEHLKSLQNERQNKKKEQSINHIDSDLGLKNESNQDNLSHLKALQTKRKLESFKISDKPGVNALRKKRTDHLQDLQEQRKEQQKSDFKNDLINLRKQRRDALQSPLLDSVIESKPSTKKLKPERLKNTPQRSISNDNPEHLQALRQERRLRQDDQGESKNELGKISKKLPEKEIGESHKGTAPDLSAIHQRRLERARKFHHSDPTKKPPQRESLNVKKPKEAQSLAEQALKESQTRLQKTPRRSSANKKPSPLSSIENSIINKTPDNLPQSLRENLDLLQKNTPPPVAPIHEASSSQADKETIEKARALKKEIMDEVPGGHETLKIPNEALPSEGNLTPKEKAKINQQEAKVLPNPKEVELLEKESLQQKIIQETGNILQKDLVDTSSQPPTGIYMELPPNLQQQFKEAGEQIAQDIARLANHFKKDSLETEELKPVFDRMLGFFKSFFGHKKNIGIDEIYNQILLWLKMIPNVSDSYLEQLAKNKTDEVILYLKSL